MSKINIHPDSTSGKILRIPAIIQVETTGRILPIFKFRPIGKAGRWLGNVPEYLTGPNGLWICCRLEMCNLVLFSIIYGPITVGVINNTGQEMP